MIKLDFCCSGVPTFNSSERLESRPTILNWANKCIDLYSMKNIAKDDLISIYVEIHVTR